MPESDTSSTTTGSTSSTSRANPEVNATGVIKYLYPECDVMIIFLGDYSGIFQVLHSFLSYTSVKDYCCLHIPRQLDI